MKSFIKWKENKETIKKLEKQIDDLKKENTSLENVMHEWCIENGISKITVNGYDIPLNEMTSATIEDGCIDKVVEWLKENDLYDQCKNKPLNSRSFNKVVKDYKLSETEEIKDLIKIVKFYKFGLRKSK